MKIKCEQNHDNRIDERCDRWIRLFDNYDRAVAFLLRISQCLLRKNQDRITFNKFLQEKAACYLSICLDYVNPELIPEFIFSRFEEEILDDWRDKNYRIYSSLVRSDNETNEVNKAIALQKVQMEKIENFAHPQQWAALNLIGDW